MKRYILCLLLCIITTSLLWAQTLSPKVSPTSGGFATGTGISLSWTMGETFNTSLQQSTTLLTQGHQQPEVDILTGTITGSTFCAGSAVSVPFIAKGYYGGSNVFTAQLSNSSGSFASPVNIGTLSSTGSGTVSCTIPSNTALGTGYRIRVIANLPVYRGKDNGNNLTITPLNTFTAIVTNVSGCGTSTTTGSIAVTASGGFGAKYYSKDNGANYQGASVFANLSAATYIVRVKDANGCTSSSSNYIVNTSAGITFTTAITNATSCTAANGQIRVTASGGAGYYNYSKNGGTSYQTGNIFITLTAGTYSLKVKDVSGCTSTVVPVVVGPTCREENSTFINTESGMFNIYPNPATSQATIVFSSDKEESFTIQMIDLTGRSIRNSSNTSVIGENQFQVNLTDVSRGIYLVILQNSAGILQKKLIVE